MTCWGAHLYLWRDVPKPSGVLRCSPPSVHSVPYFSPQALLHLETLFLCMPCHQKSLIFLSIFTLLPNGHFSVRSSFCHLKSQCSPVWRTTEPSWRLMLSGPRWQPHASAEHRWPPALAFQVPLGMWWPKLSDYPVACHSTVVLQPFVLQARTGVGFA